MILGYVLRKIRLIKGYSLTQLSSITKLSKSSISNIEIGKNNPTVDTLNKICDALNISSSKLLSLTNDVTEDVSESEIKCIVDAILNNDEIYSIKTDSSKDIKFKDPVTAMEFILSQPSIMDFGNFDVNKLSDEDKINFANDLLSMIKMISPKYKR